MLTTTQPDSKRLARLWKKTINMVKAFQILLFLDSIFIKAGIGFFGFLLLGGAIYYCLSQGVIFLKNYKSSVVLFAGMREIESYHRILIKD